MFSLLIGATLLLAGQVQKGTELRGTWLFKSGSLNGEPILFPPRGKIVFIFDDDNKLIIRCTGRPDRVGKFSIGPGTLTKGIDITPLGEDEETSIGGLGIYKLEGNSLVFALASQRVNGKESRPTKFDAQKGILVVRLEKMKPNPANEPSTPPKPGEKSPALTGRWELISEEKSNESMEIEFVKNIFSNQKILSVHSQFRGSLFGVPIRSEKTVRISWVDLPDGRKNVIGLVEKIDEKNQGRVCLIRSYFRGETLELLGQVSPDGFGTINLTGEWRHFVNKNR